MLKDFIKLSVSSLVKRKLRSWLTIIGVVIGILAVVSLIGLGEGLRNFVTGQFNLVGTDIITIQAAGISNGPPGSGVVNPLTKQDLARIRTVKGVDTAVGRLVELGSVNFNDKTYFGYFASVPEGEYLDDMVDILNYETEYGRFLKDDDTFRVVVGMDYTNKDRFGKPVEVGTRLDINDNTYTVVGINEKRGSFIVDNTVLLIEDRFREEFDVDNEELDAIAVRVEPGAEISEVKERLEKLLRKQRDVKEGEEDFTVETPENALDNLNQTLTAVQMFVVAIASISLIVGVIGILNTMYTSVLERTNDIGVMKAIGAKNSTIFILYFIESGLIGMVGGIFGVILGFIISYGLAAAAQTALGIDNIQAQIEWWLILGALAVSFVVGSVAGILPAMRASKMRPVEALSEQK